MPRLAHRFEREYRARPAIRLAIGLTAFAAVAATAALATTPGTNGRIAFRRYLNDQQTKSALFVMNADGTQAQQITSPPRGIVDDQPDWSPDGSQLVFYRAVNGPFYVATVRADGSGFRRVTPACTRKLPPDRIPAGCEDASEASFTPDGQHVTYARATGRIRHFPKFQYDQIEHAAVAIIGLDGSGGRELLRLPRYAGDIHFPQVSPNGRLIVFERVNSPLSRPRFARALFVMNVDGSGVHRVTPWKLAAGDNPDWAPDSSRIIFRSKEDVDDERSQYFTVHPDGTGLTQLTHFQFSRGHRLFSAAFSPDGSQIVFARGDGTGRGDIWLMNADGGNPHPILTAKPWDSAPDWGSG
jgi:Tol biopolymer transport system component